MAKERRRNPFLLFAIAVALLTAGWLMKSLPIFIFAGLAPLFALTDRMKKESTFWESSELILLALFVLFYAGFSFRVFHLLTAIVQSIAFGVVFVAFGFTKEQLGDVGKLPLLFFWLAMEYLLFCLHWPRNSLFLADALALKTDWLHWNRNTGYLGGSFWILACNLIFYYSCFRTDKINWPLLVLFLFCLAAPIVFSYLLREGVISREAMIPERIDILRTLRGEFIPRIAAVCSVLILLIAIVKSKVEKQ